MPNQTQAALARNWAILIALILRIRGRAVPSTRRNGERRKHLLHLLRLGESLARRWLVLNAGFCRPETSGRHVGKPRGKICRSPVRRALVPLLGLLESNPVLRQEDYALHPFDPGLAPHPCSAKIGTAPDEAGTMAAITRRAQALLDVMQRPKFHTARMARKLNRAASNARAAFVRRHPLRVGRPPGARRRDKKCEIQAALWWLDTLARDSLLPGWVP